MPDIPQTLLTPGVFPSVPKPPVVSLAATPPPAPVDPPLQADEVLPPPIPFAVEDYPPAETPGPG